ncbi:hypothetical protein CR513_30675, partial [Mucuna pruriens]
MIDAASRGALMDKTLAATRHLISNMAIDNLRLENQLTELTSLVRQLAIGQHQPTIATRQKVLVQGDSPSLEDLMKQLAANNLKFQQNMNSSNMQFHLPSQSIPNLRRNESAVTLRSGKELQQPTPQ